MGWNVAEKLGVARFMDTVKGDLIANDDKPKRRKTTVTRNEVNELRKRIGLLESKLERRDATIERLKERLAKKKVVVRRSKA
jgi:hypothetical protein